MNDRITNLNDLALFLAELYQDSAVSWLHGLCENYPWDVKRAVLEYWHTVDDKRMPTLQEVFRIVKQYREKTNAASPY